jgi:hypothetical protein
MEKVSISFKQFPDEINEYTVVRDNESLESYINQLRYETTINTIRFKRKGGVLDGISGLQHVYQRIHKVTIDTLIYRFREGVYNINREYTPDDIIRKDDIIILKETTMRNMLEKGHLLYVNENGGILPHSDNLIINKTWYEENE